MTGRWGLVNPIRAEAICPSNGHFLQEQTSDRCCLLRVDNTLKKVHTSRGDIIARKPIATCGVEGASLLWNPQTWGPGAR